jgi:hypothetical protein
MPGPGDLAIFLPTEKKVVQRLSGCPSSSISLSQIAGCIAARVEENADRSGRPIARLSNYQFNAVPHFRKLGYPPIFLGRRLSLSSEVIFLAEQQNDQVSILLNGAAVP